MKPLILCVVLLTHAGVALAQQPAPDLFISVNGVGNLTLYPGWPLIVQLMILNSTRAATEGAAPLTVSPSGHIWTDAIHVQVVSSSGQALDWPLTLVGSPSDPALTLQPDSSVRMTLQLSADNVSALALDTYQLTVSIEVSNSAGWNGSVRSQPAAITIAPEPTLDVDLQSDKSLLLAEYALNRDDFDTAIRTTQQLLLAQPDNTQAMAAAADVLETAGYTGLAFVQAGAALNAYRQANPTLSEAPSNLLTLYQRLLTEMATPDGSPLATTTVAQGVTLGFSPDARSVQLNAVVSSGQGTVDAGTVAFTVTGVPGSVTSGPVTSGNASATLSIPGGTTAGKHPIQATYSGTSAWSGSEDLSEALTIVKATPIVTWQNPIDIRSGAALGPAQLNATANVPGSFAYNPAAGTILPVGTGQLLTTTFSPSDAVDYDPVTASVFINVTASTLVGDVNGDGVVNCTDLNGIKAAFGKRAGQPGFDSRADVNGDGVINVLDLSIVARLLPAGTTCG